MNYKRMLLLKCIGFILLFILIIPPVSFVFQNKTDAEVLYTYRNEKPNTLDVLFIGSSHSYRFIHPMYLWNYYGITSYNLGSSEQTIPQSYHLLQMALNTQKPKLVVLDLFMIKTDSKTISSARSHQIFDNMPPSFAWLNAIRDIEQDNILPYLFPLITYHSRWNELKRSDFSPIISHSKGALFNYKTAEFPPIDFIPADQKRDINSTALEYLLKIIDLCQSNGIQLLLAVFPYPVINATVQEYYHTARDLASEHNVDFISLIDKWDDIGLIPTQDFSDSNHVNMRGAIKLTDYIGRYLTSNYDLPDQRKDPAYASWHSDFEFYLQELKHTLHQHGKSVNAEYLPIVESRFSDYYLGDS